MSFKLLFVLILASGVPNSGANRAKARDKLPIREDEVSSFNLNDEDSRLAAISSASLGQHSKASECRFADNRYELEETWHPDLGSPFGIMYCVHCECVAIQKKRRVVGRVRCKNIKTECPKVNCPDPVLLPGRCCKICPGETENPDLTIEVDLKREEEEKNGRHYASVLRPAANADGSSGKPTVATGRFLFRKKTLSYSFVTSPEFGWPKLITFLDRTGDIIEEFPIQMTHFQSTTGKTCGSWQRLPRRYRQQLRGDSIHVQLTNADGVVITGRISKHYGLSYELFSGLAVSTTGGDEAATAIVSVTSLAGTGSVHLNLLMSGLFNEDGVKSAGLEVRFLWDSENDTQESIIEELVIPKVNNELTEIDFKTVFDTPALEALGRGKLLLTITTKEDSPKSVTGYLAPKYSCDMFDSVLSTPQAEGEDTAAASGTPASTARGLAWMFMHRSGLIQYHIRINSLSSDLVSVQIDNGRKSKRLLRIVRDLREDFIYDQSGPKIPRSGWANGTLMMSANDIEDLYRSNLYITVATNQNEREVNGRIVVEQLGPAQELAKQPILITGDATRSPTHVSGIAWANVDSSCKLNYYVRLSSADKRFESKLSLKDYPMKNLKAMALVPIRTLELQEFYGPEVSGHQDSIHKLSLARMDSGDASFVVQHFGETPFTIEGRISGVHPPAECLPRFSRNHLELMPGYLSDLGEEKPDVGSQYAMKCVYEDMVYNNGDQWSATHESCKMCSCIKGSVACELILCPKPNCTTPKILEGQCCPTCQMDLPDGDTQGCWFEGDKQFHRAGSKWHPYIPPWGFSRCAVCTCLASELEVKCESKSCPPVDCPIKQQIRPDALACCKVCNESIALELDEEEIEEELPSSDPDRPHDMASEKTDQDVLDLGGCVWRDEVKSNGAVWQPRVLPYGRVNCVSCNCKDGHTRCQKQACQKLTCRMQIKDKEKCCPRCAVGSAEVKRARKLQRLQKLRKLRRFRRLRQQQEALHEEVGEEEQTETKLN